MRQVLAPTYRAGAGGAMQGWLHALQDTLDARLEPHQGVKTRLMQDTLDADAAHGAGGEAENLMLGRFLDESSSLGELRS